MGGHRAEGGWGIALASLFHSSTGEVDQVEDEGLFALSGLQTESE